jgi:hypothetical protein
VSTVRELDDNGLQHGGIVKCCTSGQNLRRCVLGQRREPTKPTEQGDQTVISGDKIYTVASARRRLIRGTFAAPAVLALHSGGALAATSLSCLARQVPSNTTQVVVNFVETPPAWLRVQLWAFFNGSTVKSNAYWIRGADLPVVPGQTNFLSGTEYWQFDTTNNVLTGPKLSSQPTVSGGGFTWQAVSKYVSLRVASGGAILSAGATTVSTQTSAVSYSCWASFITSP